MGQEAWSGPSTPWRDLLIEAMNVLRSPEAWVVPAAMLGVAALAAWSMRSHDPRK